MKKGEVMDLEERIEELKNAKRLLQRYDYSDSTVKLIVDELYSLELEQKINNE
jgi:hypothetical protein